MSASPGDGEGEALGLEEMLYGPNVVITHTGREKHLSPTAVSI